VFCAQMPTAGMCPMPDYTRDETVVAPDGDTVFGEKIYSSDPNTPKLVTHNDMASWHFFWTAPKAGTGPLTVYVAAVDGNGGAGTAANDQDPYNDDTVAANFFLREANVPVHNDASAGCSLAPRGAAASPWPLLFVALALLLPRRRRTS
jgi:MYXO-CTERM domain-containing protein